MDCALTDKYTALRETLMSMGSVMVAFSGGVDSTLLAKVAHDALGKNMVAATAGLRSVPETELAAAQAFCAREGIDHVLVPYDELEIEGYAQNPKNRCYLCKRATYEALGALARERGIAHIVDGSNLDDAGDYRPGMQAASELGVASPLKECGFTKEDVRTLSRELGLPTWDMPAAACLASRFAYGEVIDAIKLARVESAERYLHELGFRELRVRIHGDDGKLARIEVSAADICRLASEDVRSQVVAHLRDMGFRYVTCDLMGFRSGSMNEALV